MQILSIVILVIGGLLGLTGGFWLLVVAYRNSFLWLLVTLLVPFGVLIFTACNWTTAQKPFFIWLAGFILTVVACAISPDVDWMDSMD